MSSELKTPPHRRLVRTGTTGIYRRGDRCVAITYDRGRRIKTTHDTKREACRARARRCLRPCSAGRERFEDYVERWLVEYRGGTAHGLAPSTREEYAWAMRVYVVPYFRGRRIGDIRRADVKRFVDHLAQLTRQRERRDAAGGLDDPQDHHATQGDARRRLRARDHPQRRRARFVVVGTARGRGVRRRRSRARRSRFS